MSRIRLLLFSLAAAFSLGGAIWSLWPVSDEDRVRDTISEVVQGAQQADLGAVLSPISESYDDDDGLTKDALRGFLFQQFRKRGPLGVHRGPITVQVKGDTASADFDVMLVEGTAGSLIPTDADAFSFTVELTREDGDWMVTSHSREPLQDGWRLPE